MIKDDELLEKYNEVCQKVKNNVKNEFDSEPVCNEKYLKAKMEKSTQIFTIIKYQKKVYYLNYFHQVFLEECRHIVKEKKMPEYITEETKIF